jgi:hypothetical protein
MIIDMAEYRNKKGNRRGIGLKPNVKGMPRRGGIKKGTPQKMTRFLKDAILLAGTEVGDVTMYLAQFAEDDEFLASSIEERGGLVGYLKWLAVHEPKTYAGLLGRLVPQQVSLTEDDKPEEKYQSEEDVRAAMVKRGLPLGPMYGEWAPKAIEYKAEENVDAAKE